MTDWKTIPPDGLTPCLVGWVDGSWAVGEHIDALNPNVDHTKLMRSEGWIQQGTGEPFLYPPDLFAEVTSPGAADNASKT